MSRYWRKLPELVVPGAQLRVSSAVGRAAMINDEHVETGIGEEKC